MAYRALKMRKVEKEIELLDRKLAVSVIFRYGIVRIENWLLILEVFLVGFTKLSGNLPFFLLQGDPWHAIKIYFYMSAVFLTVIHVKHSAYSLNY